VITFSLLCGALFTSFVAAFGASFVSQMWHTGQQSNDLEAPMWIGYLAIPLGSSLMCFRLSPGGMVVLPDRRLPHHNAATIDGVERRCRCVTPAAIAHLRRKRTEKGPLGWILILLPILIIVGDLLAPRRTIVLPHGVRVAIVFALLLSLMLTGMPISIALGLTVLSFMFTLTDVRTESVALKLFQRHRKLRDHGDPVFHFRRQLPYPRRVPAA